jgi:phosphoglycolate phosphatase
MRRAPALIFDLDGTLIDSIDDIASALNHALESFDRPRADVDSVRAWVGDGLPTLCRRAWPDAPNDALDALVKTAATHYRSHCLDRTAPYPNIMKMLNLLRSTGARLAVLSNKPHEFALQILDGLAMRDFFDAAHGYVREEDKKPSPTLALHIAESLGCAPHEVMFVGDSEIDIRTARNAGMISLAVTWGLRSEAELRSARPDHLVKGPEEIFFLARDFFSKKHHPGGE